jgi:hypothetical protein
MGRMENPPLQSFVTWQKAVRLAAHLYRLSWAEEHRAQGEDLRREAMHLACAIAGVQVASPTDPADWEIPLGGCAELYTRLHVAELSGALTERESRGLLGQCEELERHLQAVRRAAPRANAVGGETGPVAWPAPRPRARG